MQNLLKLLSFSPLSFQYLLADFFGLFVSAIPNRTARLIRQNIQICFPDLDRDEQRRLGRSVVRHTCYSAFELAAIWYWSVEKILGYVKRESICEAFQLSSKGRIIIVPHLGSWEILNLWLAQHGDYMALYKPQPESKLDNLMRASRSRNGADMLPVNAAGLRNLSRGLKQGKTAMILPDQRPKKSKTRSMSPFFGQDAPTTSLIYNLCSRIDCDVFLATAFRERDTGTFNICLEKLDHDILTSNQQQSLDYMNSEIENLIRQRPEQYQWGYSRFKPSTYQLYR